MFSGEYGAVSDLRAGSARWRSTAVVTRGIKSEVGQKPGTVRVCAFSLDRTGFLTYRWTIWGTPVRGPIARLRAGTVEVGRIPFSEGGHKPVEGSLVGKEQVPVVKRDKPCIGPSYWVVCAPVKLAQGRIHLLARAPDPRSSPQSHLLHRRHEYGQPPPRVAGQDANIAVLDQARVGGHEIGEASAGSSTRRAGLLLPQSQPGQWDLG